MKAYIGIAPCCGRITAALVDDEHTTPEEVEQFKQSMSETGRIFSNRKFELGELQLKRCCKYEVKPCAD